MLRGISSNEFDLAATVTIVTGVAFHIRALCVSIGLGRQMPSRSLRRIWRGMAGLIGIFIIAYLTYGLLMRGRNGSPSSLLVPAVFLLGAIFVLLTMSLTARTVRDLQRVAELEQLAISDELTGLFNRRFLLSCLENETARSRRYGLPLSALLLDIDHFKRINDLHGHDVGDLALRHVARCCQDSVRQTDIVSRYGGEEFAILLPSTPLAGAQEVAERLRSTIAQSAIALPQGATERTLCCTVSVGVAEFDPSSREIDAFLKQADEALYEAKRSGRNRVIAASPRVQWRMAGSRSGM